MEVSLVRVKKVAEKELKRYERQKIFDCIFLSIFIISILSFIVILTIDYYKLTGYASVSSQAGYITNVNLYQIRSTTFWSGLYGLVLSVPGFTEQLSEQLDEGEITRSDVFFDCILSSATGGPEFYTVNSSSISISTSTVTPATTAWVDNILNCHNRTDCANNTFTRNMTIYIGQSAITNIPSTYTYKYTGQNEIFQVGIINISGNLGLVTKINSTIQKGFSINYTVNYQTLVPIPENTTQTYYFYNDPNDACPGGGV